MNILEFIVFVLIFGGAMYFAWQDGFEQGRSAANRMHVKWWGNVRGQLRRHGETLAGLDNRIDGIEARLAKLEHPDATVLYANNEPYAVIPDTKPEDAVSTGYKFRCEPELDDVCKSCTRQGTSICYGCGFDHVFYDRNEEKPEDWNCDTCVNDGDMNHLQCRYCNEGTCYIKKEDTRKVVVVGELPDGAADCRVVSPEEQLKFNHEPSGEVIGKVVETEDVGEGIRVKIKKED